MSDAYELLAQTARYVFAALMLLIVARAARITAVDARRAAKLRRLSPMTGLSGELVVLEGDERTRRGMRYPVIREGMIGSSRRADVRIRNSSVRRRHAYFQLTESGLQLRGHAHIRLRDGKGRWVRELTLRDGGEVRVGKVRLLLVLAEATAAQEAPRDEPDRLFDAAHTPEGGVRRPEMLARANRSHAGRDGASPARGAGPRRPQVDPDALFNVDEEDGWS